MSSPLASEGTNGSAFGHAVSPLRLYRDVRRASVRLAEPLSAEDSCVQSMPDASPTKWHLAHTTWFFETLVLELAERSFVPFDSSYRVLFNSYYNTVGAQHARPHRGLLTRPPLEDVMRYRAEVDERVAALLVDPDGLDAELLARIEVGLHHEQQHQELILTDLKHMLSFNPTLPAYRSGKPPRSVSAPALEWHGFDGGINEVGHDGKGFGFDNERPRHRVHLETFELASRLVTNGEYLNFMRDGGYERPELWLSDGWNVVGRQGWRAPLYWQYEGEEWSSFTLGGLRPLREHEPVCHVSLYEADAFARWSVCRLPTEAEWEVAASHCAVDGNFVEDEVLHPQAIGESRGLDQVFGDAWEWTSSAYSPYPRYRALGGALGEYNGKFMSDQNVLRGGSCATPRSHVRATYRNFFPAATRWQFSGIRLARDAEVSM